MKASSRAVWRRGWRDTLGWCYASYWIDRGGRGVSHAEIIMLEMQKKGHAVRVEGRAYRVGYRVGIPMTNPTSTRLVTRPWMAKLEKTLLENQSWAWPGW